MFHLNKTKNMVLTDIDILNITLQNGTTIKIDTIKDSKISHINMEFKNNVEGEVESVKITDFSGFTSVGTWFKGGAKKVLKQAKKHWFKVGTKDNINSITIFKS